MTISQPLAADATASVSDADLFQMRWDRSEPGLLQPLARLYGAVTDIDALRDRVKALLADKWAARPTDLRVLDLRRDLSPDAAPDWALDPRMVGYALDVERFCGGLHGLPARLPYLLDLGVTHVHLVRGLTPRPGPSGGGPAAMDCTAIAPRPSSPDDLMAATAEMRRHGISPGLDLVLTHTARDHDWAVRAGAGDPQFQAFYWMLDDRPPARRPTPGGAASRDAQWELNWDNPEVFLAMLGHILDLANRGVEVLQLDVPAGIGTPKGTGCPPLPPIPDTLPENLPDILQALGQASRIAAPAMIHKAGAIVGAGDLVPSLCQGRHAGKLAKLAGHDALMVQFWGALAARDTRLMTHALATRFPQGFKNAGWAIYLRNHDEVAWTIADEDAAHLPPMTGPGHRTFLADFYNGSFPGSFARGEDFQAPPHTAPTSGDRRTNGTTASLAGLEAALLACDPGTIDLAVNRILMGHALIAAFGGLPLICMGDELGLPNDHFYLDDPDRAADGRWMQRPAMEWDRAERAATAEDASGWLYRGLRHILARRKALPELAGDVPTQVIDTGHPAIFALRRPGDAATITALFNFTENWQHLPVAALALGAAPLTEALSDAPMPAADRLDLPPFARLWLRQDRSFD